MYGGHIVEDWDRRLASAYLLKYFQETLADGLTLFPGFATPATNLSYVQVTVAVLGRRAACAVVLCLGTCALAQTPGESSSCVCRQSSVLVQVLDYIEESMPPETPQAFGLHPNAEIGFKLREGGRFCSAVLSLQPRGAGAEGGLSTEERVRIYEVVLSSVIHTDRRIQTTGDAAGKNSPGRGFGEAAGIVRRGGHPIPR